jgi:hypothetical protein
MASLSTPEPASRAHSLALYEPGRPSRPGLSHDMAFQVRRETLGGVTLLLEPLVDARRVEPMPTRQLSPAAAGVGLREGVHAEGGMKREEWREKREKYGRIFNPPYFLPRLYLPVNLALAREILAPASTGVELRERYMVKVRWER